jgi:hypothetical protein
MVLKSKSSLKSSYKEALAIYNNYIKKIIKRFNLLNKKCLNTLLLFFKLKKNKG